MKTKKEILIKEISGDLVNYLKLGYLSINSFLDKINLEIENIEDLLKIHFLLLEDVRNYILALPNLLRRLRVSTNLEEEITNEKLNGSINWQNTLKERLKRNYKDKTLFCQTKRNRYYNTKENIVLKKFIEVLYEIIVNLKTERFVKYDWFKNGSAINNIIRHIYEKNVYMTRINLDYARISDRMIEDVARNRNVLYRNAAKFLREYYKIINLNADYDEIKKFFENTFIEIADEDTLFELYWIVKILKSNAKNYKMYLVDGKNNKIASFEDEKDTYSIYHNSTGSSDLTFKVEKEEIEDLIGKNEYITRLVDISKDFSVIFEGLFNRQSFDLNLIWSGRPDFLIEVRDKETKILKRIILGEVKYTIDYNYMLEGLRQLLEYMYFMKYKNKEYIYKNQNLEIKGMLFVDNVPLEHSGSEIKSVRVFNIKCNELKI